MPTSVPLEVIKQVVDCLTPDQRALLAMSWVHFKCREALRAFFIEEQEELKSREPMRVIGRGYVMSSSETEITLTKLCRRWDELIVSTRVFSIYPRY